MANQNISVVYYWTAHEGKSDELISIYKDVEKQMVETEPKTIKMDCFFDEGSRMLIVHDVFEDAEALGFHLGVTAAGHFKELSEIATPGKFLFIGDIPEEMQKAAINLGLDATFAPYSFGFNRKA